MSVCAQRPPQLRIRRLKLLSGQVEHQLQLRVTVRIIKKMGKRKLQSESGKMLFNNYYDDHLSPGTQYISSHLDNNPMKILLNKQKIKLGQNFKKKLINTKIV